MTKKEAQYRKLSRLRRERMEKVGKPIFAVKRHKEIYHKASISKEYISSLRALACRIEIYTGKAGPFTYQKYLHLKEFITGELDALPLFATNDFVVFQEPSKLIIVHSK